MGLRKDREQQLDKLELSLTALVGVRRCRRVAIPHDPELYYLELMVDPIVITSVKGQVLQVLTLSTAVLFSNSSQWLGAPGKPGKPFLFLVDGEGLQLMVGIFGQGTPPERLFVEGLPEYHLSLAEDAAAAVYLEGLFVGLRQLRAGNVLGAQGAVFRCLEALRLLLAQHFKQPVEGEDGSLASGSWAVLASKLPGDLVRLLEAILGDLQPLALSSHLVQLTNVTLHLLESVAPEQLGQLPVAGLAKAREWLEGGLLFRRSFIAEPEPFEAFNSLAKQVFGLDFAPWVASGHWTRRYQPYTFFHEGEAIANVSLTQITLLLEGQQVPGIQIGTVMIHPKWRRRGLSRELFERVFLDYPPCEYLYFLAADAEAVPLYKACGFLPWQPQRYWVDITPTHQIVLQSIKPPGEHVDTCTPELLVKLHGACEPVSRHLGVLDDDGILVFYGVLGLMESLYEIQPGIYALMSTEQISEKGPQEGQVALMVYRFFVPEGVDYSYNHLLERAAEAGYSRVEFLFSPDQSAEPVKGLQWAPESQEDGGWMVHGGYSCSFPQLGRFPKISQT